VARIPGDKSGSAKWSENGLRKNRGGTYVLVFGEWEDVPLGIAAVHRVHEIPKAVKGNGDVAGQKLRSVQGGDGETLGGCEKVTGRRPKMGRTNGRMLFVNAAAASSSVYLASVLRQMQASLARGRPALEDIAVQKGCGSNLGALESDLKRGNLKA
jgi:hypothetical protein